MTTALHVLPPKLTTDVPLTPNQIAERLTGRDYLSYSAISTYQRCPLRYFFVYVAGLISHNVFKITSGGMITEIIDATGDGAGNALQMPKSVSVDSSGNVYVGEPARRGKRARGE